MRRRDGCRMGQRDGDIRTRQRDGEGRMMRPRWYRWTKSDGADPEFHIVDSQRGRRRQEEPRCGRCGC